MSNITPHAGPSIAPILKALISSSQLDALHLAIGQLQIISLEGELELFLSLPRKSSRQKELFLRKIASDLPSPLLAAAIETMIETVQFDFFNRGPLEDFLRRLQVQAEAIDSIPLTVAIQFKAKDIASMASTLSKQLGHQIVLDITIESALIGGAIISHASHRYDYSLKTKLVSFRSTWVAAVSKS